MTNIQFENILINFGFGTKEEKKQILKENSHKDVFMDLTCYDPQEFYSAFPQLKGSFAALFCDGDKKVEVNMRQKNDDFISLISFTKALRTSKFERFLRPSFW